LIQKGNLYFSDATGRKLAKIELFAGALAFAISVAVLMCVDLRCRPGDVTTTNGRPLCAPH